MSKQYAEPEIKRGSALQSKEYPVKANEEWVYVFQPTCWQFVNHRGEMKWLPQLAEQPMVRGANGITGDATDRDGSLYVAQAQRNGFKVIQPNDPALGPYKHYVRTVPCVWKGRKGTHHISPWEDLHVLAGKVRKRVDMDGFYDFLEYLVEHGVVEPMSDIVLEEEEEKAARRIDNIELRAARNDAPESLKKRLQAAIDKRQAMRPAWEAQFGPDAGKKTRKKKASA